MEVKKLMNLRSQSYIDYSLGNNLAGSHVFVAIFASLGKILSVSKGRDKFLGLIQHIGDLYKNCMVDYLATYRIKEWPVSLNNANSLQNAIKDGRKFLRLLKWIEEMGNVESKIHSKMSIVMFLKVFRHGIGICYYLVDNTLWFIHIGVSSKRLNHLLLEKTKEIFSLLRYLLRVVIFFLTYNEEANKEKALTDKLRYSTETMRFNTYDYINLSKVIEARSKRRYQSFEMIINVLRLFMICKSLRVPGSKHISKVFQSVCGIVSGAFSLFKMLTCHIDKN